MATAAWILLPWKNMFLFFIFVSNQCTFTMQTHLQKILLFLCKQSSSNEFWTSCFKKARKNLYERQKDANSLYYTFILQFFKICFTDTLTGTAAILTKKSIPINQIHVLILTSIESLISRDVSCSKEDVRQCKM